MTCSKCREPAVIFVKYSGQHLCRGHFLEFTDRRIRREIRKQGPYPEGSRIAIALSGGKDSVVLLHQLHAVFAENPRVSLVAVSVDEGIAGYRPPALDIAARNCERLGVQHVVHTYHEEAGLTMDEVMGGKPEGRACTYCGPLRRRSLNAAAKVVGATHLATGHNLDDTAQTVLMNQVRGDVDRLARLGPHPPARVKPGLVPRLMPLRQVPEKEIALYAILRGLEYHDGECPYAGMATRGRFRDLLLALETETPGTRHAIVAGFDRVAPLLWEGVPEASVQECSKCGEPSSGALCKGCQLVASLKRPASASSPE